MPTKSKESLLDRIKEWLYAKLYVWHLKKVWDFDEVHIKNLNNLFRTEIAAKITADFGPKCKSLNLSCSSCQAHLASDIIRDLYYEEGNEPNVFNKDIQHPPSENQTSASTMKFCAKCGRWAIDHDNSKCDGLN
jgi:hypothetical protein